MHNYAHETFFLRALWRECYFENKAAIKHCLLGYFPLDSKQRLSERRYNNLRGPVMMLRGLSGAPQLKRGR